MNKKELNAFKKEFKEDSIMLNIKEVYSIYVKKDNRAVVHTEFNYFDSFETEIKELYLSNFKKLLTGTIDTKVFELDFKTLEAEQEELSQKILYAALQSSEKEEIENNIDSFMKKVLENYSYETDIVVTFIKGEYFKGSNKRKKEYDESIDDKVEAFQFLMGSINKIEGSKKALIFDYEDKRFAMNYGLDSIINLAAPLEGFMFPSFDNGYADVNKVIYYNPKAKDSNLSFIEKVLECDVKLTGQEEKDCFINILKTAVGDKIKPEVMQDIYTRIHSKIEEEEENPIVGIKDIEKVLKEINVEVISDLGKAFEECCGTNYDFKVNNILPDFNTKSIKITSESANITITPKELNTLRQVKDKNGNKCLLIELTDDIEIEGFKLETEEGF